MDIPEDEFRMLPDINYLGTGTGTRVALRRILPRKPDAIGPVASTISNRAVSPQRPGSSSEHATRGFTAAARTELVYQGSPVRLTMVRPPWSARRSTPTRGRPCRGSSVRRQAVAVDGEGGEPMAAFALGNKFVPELKDWLMGKTGLF